MEAPLHLLNESGAQCTLFLSMSRTPQSGDERQSEALDSQILEAQPDRPRFSHSNPMASQWDAALRRVRRLFKTLDQSSVQVPHNQSRFGISCDVQIRLLDIYWIQQYIYHTSQVPSCVLILRHLADHAFFQRCLTQHSYAPQVDVLLNTLLMAADRILQSRLTRMQHKEYYMDGIRNQLYWLADYIDDLARFGRTSE